MKYPEHAYPKPYDLKCLGNILILSYDLPSIKKRRYHWNGADGSLWEVDEFEDSLAGLIIAEVELESVDQSVDLPPWLGMELTNLRGWSNASLSMMIKDSGLD